MIALPAHRPGHVVLLVVATLACGIAFDALGPAWGQAAVVAWTWAALAWIAAGLDTGHRRELAVCLVLATLGELFLMELWGLYHYRVDTVPFGAFRKQLVERIGYYDETLLTNEDYEFNTRVRNSGGTVWLDPEIRSIYYARSTFKELARQYWRYGYWKARMLKRYPESTRWRQALPPLMVVSFILHPLLSIVWPIPRWIFMLELFFYSLLLLAAGFQSALKKKDPSLIISVPLAIACMHFSWGSAFIWSLLRK